MVKIAFDVNDVVVDGEKYWQVNSFQHSSEVQTGAEFNFQNLFNGNKQLGE